MSDNTYNGWTNRETWLVNLWFDPESVSDVDNAREYIEEEVNKLPPFMRDFIDISCINWNELKSYFDDETSDDTDDELNGDPDEYKEE